MEPPVRSALIVRSAAAGIMAAILALAWCERRSALGQALREGRPCLFWLALKTGPEPTTRALFTALGPLEVVNARPMRSIA